ncbi:hypothetical protein QN277_006220 [Acacia crassicarpa]|uniref:RING-type domain-containing protein n=1 Tax=Acacia crassicarpa TaxID=499986 RepID=A0AAE1MCC6_9FABA|nr:hypothetical protein QN277_006220 [Acacia crassicarpa]
MGSNRELECWQQLIQSLTEAITCEICLDREKEISFRCKHTACEVCASRSSFSICHICQEPLTNHRRLFL